MACATHSDSCLNAGCMTRKSDRRRCGHVATDKDQIKVIRHWARAGIEVSDFAQYLQKSRRLARKPFTKLKSEAGRQPCTLLSSPAVVEQLRAMKHLQ